MRTAPSLEGIFTAAPRAAISRRRRSTRSGPAPAALATRSSTNSRRRRSSTSGAAPGDALARRLRRAARRHQHAGHPADPLAGRHVRLARRGRAAESRQSDRDLEPAAPPIRGVDNAKVAYNQTGAAGRRMSWGVVEQSDRIRTRRSAIQKNCRRCSRRRPHRRQGAVLRAAGAGAQAEEPPEHSRAVPVDGCKLSPQYDHCLAKWLNQAGVKTQVRRTGNRRYSGQQPRDDAREEQRDIAKCIGTWLGANARPGRGENPSKAMPPKSITTFSTDASRAKVCFMRAGSMVRRRPPRDARRYVHRGGCPGRSGSPYPVILFHGNGQTATQWMQTPDGRAGWAYRLSTKATWCT